jgi:L-seryl-tRNA(Ser) seleniumtransferase
LLVGLLHLGLTGEPTAGDALRAGATVVTMSGDKLLGGPQAGIILGSRSIVERIRKNPLTRSYRVDKLTLAALEATLGLYRDPAVAMREIPVLAQLSATIGALTRRAQSIVDQIGSDRISIVASEASVGGGAFPTAKIASIAFAIDGKAEEIEARLRSGNPTVVARVADGRVVLDLRTVFPTDDAALAAAIQTALA